MYFSIFFQLHSDVTKEVISEKLFCQHYIRISPESVLLSAPIDKLGETEVQISVFEGVELPLKVNVLKR